MSERRRFRAGPRTDQQILAHEPDMFLLAEIEQQRVRVQPELRGDLRRLVLDDLIIAGFGRGTAPAMLPRGSRLLAVYRGQQADQLE